MTTPEVPPFNESSRLLQIAKAVGGRVMRFMSESFQGWANPMAYGSFLAEQAKVQAQSPSIPTAIPSQQSEIGRSGEFTMRRFGRQLRDDEILYGVLEEWSKHPPEGGSERS